MPFFAYITVISFVGATAVAAGLSVYFYRTTRRRLRASQNALALASLNLAAMGSPGNEADRVLAETLECLTGIFEFPSGAIFLENHPAGLRSAAAGLTGPLSVGLDPSFCVAAQSEKFDECLTRLVTRLGGIATFHDLEGAASLESLQGDEDFALVRQLAMSQGMHSLVSVTLNRNDEPCGVLFLAGPQARRLSKGEMRLLVAVSKQMGAAIENCRLMRQTERRSEELHVLNEVGRALSATLDPDALFEKIFTEMQRLFQVSNFYIALFDEAENQIRFELEVAEGVRLPKRVRPLGNYLTEIMLRTREPILIRENFRDEARKLGAVPVQQGGSFCGVPLIAYERAIGVMVMRGLEENRFDEGHLEMMRLLASGASIAIENARLFQEEQTKSRHLVLLNSISRSAITTLNPQEMLANIAEQLERGLDFDHMGIGLLDYARKEVVVQAEAGTRRGALGKRLELDESFVGSVARTGQLLAARDVAKAGSGEPVLEDSASAIALPIVYAEQLHGVLYVETVQPTEFSETERLMLLTLADLISGALHNALTFQRAQEQAITDGLTGVKTHRFLMEALSAEWKRSTRANRSFSLALIDLDRFKFVNDFYGHLEGDLVLKRVGHVLEEHCRRSDVVARYGGDEFVILMPETNLEQSGQIAETLRSKISTDMLLREKRITASLGIACFPINGATPQELIQVADASMYLSKHQGGNAVSTAENYDPNETREWKRNVLEAYLGVTLKRLFATGPDALEEICARMRQFAQSLEMPVAPDKGGQTTALARKEGSELPVIETVTSLALAIDAKDHFTQGHCQKVAVYAALIASKLGLSGDEIEEIRIGGMLHDIGKVGIPEEILNKNGPLNAEEWEVMKAHARYGDEILSPLETLTRVRAMVRHHHEMFDGSGYPDGLEGARIPLGARIIAIADAYDTITSDRVYKKARVFGAACVEIERCAGAQFDPDLVRVFIESVRDMSNQPLDAGEVPAREATL